MVLHIDSMSVGPKGRILLKSLDFSLKAGEVLVIAGPNGAGKSTLMRALSGETRPLAGSVQLEGRALHELAPELLATHRAYLTQEDHLRFSFEVKAVVCLGGYPHRHRVAAETIEQRALSLLEMLGLSAFSQRDYQSLSGGEKLRVQLARALLQVILAPPDRPRWLLLDEPTASLDLRHQVAALQLVRQLAKEQGFAACLVLHDLNLAARFADRLALIDGPSLKGPAPPSVLLEASLLTEVYGLPLEVHPHASSGLPLVQFGGSWPHSLSDASLDLSGRMS